MAIAPTAGPGTSAGLVRTLLAEQAPALVGLPVERLADGWDNHTFRLGERMVVRLPRHEAAAELHADEVRWLPELGPQLTTATPQPVAVGGPSPHFPHPWSVVEYIPGREAAAVPPAERVVLAGKVMQAAQDACARIAAEHGVDPATVPGTGTGGRVTKRDIVAFIESGTMAPAAPPPSPP